MDTDTEMPRGRAPCEGEGRDQADADRSQGMLRLLEAVAQPGAVSRSQPWREPALLTLADILISARLLDLSLLASQFRGRSLPVAGALLQKPSGKLIEQ